MRFLCLFIANLFLHLTSSFAIEIPAFPVAKVVDEFVFSVADVDIKDYNGRSYDRFIDTTANDKLYSLIKPGNDDIKFDKMQTGGKQNNSYFDDIDYNISTTTRARVLANTTILTINNPEFLSQGVYSYYITSNE